MTLAEMSERILRFVDGKIVCEMRLKDDGFVASDLCVMGEDDGKVVQISREN